MEPGADAGAPPDAGGIGREAGPETLDAGVDGSDAAIDATAADPMSTNVNGAVNGHTVAPADARAFLATDDVDGRPAPSATIYIADYAPFCNGGLKANGTVLRLHVSTEQAAIHVGSYPVTVTGRAPGTDQASSDFLSMTATCKPLFRQPYGASGTIEVTSISTSELRGRFHVTYDNGDSVLGTFVAPTACPTPPSETVCLP